MGKVCQKSPFQMNVILKYSYIWLKIGFKLHISEENYLNYTKRHNFAQAQLAVTFSPNKNMWWNIWVQFYILRSLFQLVPGQALTPCINDTSWCLCTERLYWDHIIISRHLTFTCNIEPFHKRPRELQRFMVEKVHQGWYYIAEVISKIADF